MSHPANPPVKDCMKNSTLVACATTPYGAATHALGGTITHAAGLTLAGIATSATIGATLPAAMIIPFGFYLFEGHALKNHVPMQHYDKACTAVVVALVAAYFFVQVGLTMAIGDVGFTNACIYTGIQTAIWCGVSGGIWVGYHLYQKKQKTE